MGRLTPLLAGFGVTLNHGPIPEGIGSGIRDSNGLYNEMTTALEWRLTPDQWYEATRAARAMMIATSIMKARIENAVLDANK
jgi:hypothetical protein